MEVNMAIASEKRMRGGELLNRAISSAVFHESSCARCGGLMVGDFCMDLMWKAADRAEATAQEYRRQVPHNQVN